MTILRTLLWRRGRLLRPRFKGVQISTENRGYVLVGEPVTTQLSLSPFLQGGYLGFDTDIPFNGDETFTVYILGFQAPINLQITLQVVPV